MSAAHPFHRRPHIRPASLAAVVAALAFGAAAVPARAQTERIEVQVGDTFSAIAARYTGSIAKWKTLFDPAESGITDPNRIYPGMVFELADAPGGRRYLRLVSSPTAAAAPAPAPRPARAAAAPAAVPAPAPAPVVPPAATAPAVAASDTLVVGILPNIGPAALMAQYENLKHYLERLNPQQKVRITLPANFKSFYDGLMAGEFDLAVSAPHFARVAQRDGRMVPLALYEPNISAQWVTVADSPITSVRDLRGKAVAFANPQSLVAMYGREWLRGNQLEDGKDYTVKGARTDMGVGRMLLTGEADAAIMSNGEFRSLPPEESSRLKIVDIFARIPNFVVLGQPKLGTERLAQLKSQLLTFTSDASDGAAFTKATGIAAIVEPDELRLRELDPYVAPTKRAMTGSN